MGLVCVHVTLVYIGVELFDLFVEGVRLLLQLCRLPGYGSGLAWLVATWHARFDAFDPL